MTLTLDPPAPAAPPATPEPEDVVASSLRSALDALAALGGPNEIAAHLTERGHVGEPGCPSRCAIATHLHAVVSGLDAVAVTHSFGVSAFVSRPPYVLYVAELPHCIRHFLGRFDNGDYPDLVYRTELL